MKKQTQNFHFLYGIGKVVVNLLAQKQSLIFGFLLLFFGLFCKSMGYRFSDMDDRMKRKSEMKWVVRLQPEHMTQWDAFCEKPPFWMDFASLSLERGPGKDFQNTSEGTFLPSGMTVQMKY